jgi:lipoprotein-anchoring transpeptidase ErfK/SrfK
MRRAVRYLFVMVAISAMSLAGSATRSVAAIPVSQPVPGVESVLPANGAVVGVAHPVVVTFTAPVADRAAAERSIRVISPSGVYVHSAPWSVDSQGYANVSHGCINLSPDNAAWYFNMVNIGDPINVVA